MGRAKRQALMDAEYRSWTTTDDLDIAVAILRFVARAVGPGGFKGSITGQVLHEEKSQVVLAWELKAGGGAIIPCLWFTTQLERDNGLTTIELEVQRAKFITHFFVFTSMAGASKLRAFKTLLTQELDR